MDQNKVTVLDIINHDFNEHDTLHLQCLCGQSGLSRTVTIANINRPGLALSGFFYSFAYQRVQLFGQGESAYLQKITHDNELENLEKFFTYDIPCCIFSHSITPPDAFITLAKANGCPILQTDLSSTELSQRLMRLLVNIFSPRSIEHGVLVEVYGIGILIKGEAGLGKSETALELIERGHRLVADDAVKVSCINGNTLIGKGANKKLGHYMEIRGLGIINIMQLYGVRSVREQKEIQLVVQLEKSDSSSTCYNRIGAEEPTIELLNVKLPLLKIQVKAGRNIPIILETAAMNKRLQNMGHFSTKDFTENILHWIESDGTHVPYRPRVPYYSDDDTY